MEYSVQFECWRKLLQLYKAASQCGSSLKVLQTSVFEYLTDMKQIWFLFSLWSFCTLFKHYQSDMQSYKASGCCEIPLAAAPAPNSHSGLTLSHSFQPKANKYTHSEKCNWKSSWNYFRHTKNPKHMMLNTSEGNGTLGTLFLYHELKQSLNLWVRKKNMSRWTVSIQQQRNMEWDKFHPN